MINIIEDTSLTPRCPHCETDITTIACEKVKSTLGVRYLYFCPKCRKVLGVSQRKGFWMG